MIAQPERDQIRGAAGFRHEARLERRSGRGRARGLARGRWHVQREDHVDFRVSGYRP